MWKFKPQCIYHYRLKLQYRSLPILCITCISISSSSTVRTIAGYGTSPESKTHISPTHWMSTDCWRISTVDVMEEVVVGSTLVNEWDRLKTGTCTVRASLLCVHRRLIHSYSYKKTVLMGHGYDLNEKFSYFIFSFLLFTILN